MKPLESAIRNFFQARVPEVLAVYLFGSEARGTAGARSDIDIAVLLAHDPPSTFAGLCLDLESTLARRLAREVDLVVLNRAPPDLVHRVLRDARLLIDRDAAARIRFEVKARNEYFDLQPILEQCRRRQRTER
jgi:predicted nucleotidyltransferase